VLLYGLSYALRGIPADDLEKHWYDVNELPTDSRNFSTLVDQRTVATIEHVRILFFFLIIFSLQKSKFIDRIHLV
jgi:hypothetical protein